MFFHLLQFDIYISKYLTSFPELSGKDFPTFSEFDSDRNGHVTFQEWKKFIDLQKENENQKATSAALQDDAYGNLLSVLYDNDDSSVGDVKPINGI